MNTDITEQHIVCNGLDINYIDIGSGDVLVFLHNGGGFWQSWVKQLTYFSASHRVIALDWPGFGKSDEPDSLLSVELFYEVLKDFINKLQLSAVTLIGNCIGGSAALLYAQKHPIVISNLIIFNICPGKLIFPNKFFRVLIPKLNQYPRLKKTGASLLKFSFTKTWLKNRFPGILFAKGFSAEDPLFHKYLEVIKKPKQTRSRINLLFSVHTYTLTDYYDANAKSDCLLVWGDDNQVTDLATHGNYHKARITHDDFVVIPNSGHLCMYEQPEKVNQVIESYLKQP
ncbi:MAG: alpha/beta hydrolase [Bacteroidota bacterium]